MPIHKVEGGYQWGDHGKVYPNRAGAEKQAAAAHANGYQEKLTDQIFPDAFKKMVDDAAERISKNHPGPVKPGGLNAPKQYKPPSKGDNDGSNTPPYDPDGDGD